MIVNDEGNDQKLQAKNIFENMVAGEPEIEQQSFDNIKGMQASWTNIFPRKDEVQDILVFLKEVNNTILVVVGQLGVSRHHTIARALRFAVEHDYTAVQDGAYFIDLAECKTITDVYQKIIQMLGLSIQPKRD